MNKIMIIACVLILILTGCSHKQQSKEITMSKKNTVNEKESEYITMTVTGHNNGVNADDGMTVQIWYYEPKTSKASNVFNFEASAQYSLGYYDKKNNLVYYVKRIYIKDTYGDQIFVKNLKDNTEKQLTTNLFAVNHIVALDTKVYIVACEKNERVDKLGCIDLKTGVITFWKDDNDTSIRSISVNKQKEKIYVSTYSMIERDENTLNQKNDDLKIGLYKLYQVDFDFKTSKVLYSDNVLMLHTMTYDNTVTALCDKKIFSKDPPDVVTYNTETKKSSISKWNAIRFRSAPSADYSYDGKKIYGISIVDNVRGLCEYDVETKKMKLLLTNKEGFFINNIYVVK